MNTCLKHMQSYPLGAHCPYCGPPQFVTFTGTALPDCLHAWVETTAPFCIKCGVARPPDVARQPDIPHP